MIGIYTVIPAQAGTQGQKDYPRPWVPAFAGTTEQRCGGVGR